jgi:hypothetical protein
VTLLPCLGLRALSRVCNHADVADVCLLALRIMAVTQLVARANALPAICTVLEFEQVEARLPRRTRGRGRRGRATGWVSEDGGNCAGH